MPHLLLADADRIFANHPRPRWAGKVLGFVAQAAEDEAPLRLDTGDRLEVQVDAGWQATVVCEVPWMRLPVGMRQVVVLSLDSAVIFANHGATTREVACRLTWAAGRTA